MKLGVIDIIIIFKYLRFMVCGKWRRIHKEELHSLYRLPNVVRVIKTRRLRTAEVLSRL